MPHLPFQLDKIEAFWPGFGIEFSGWHAQHCKRFVVLIILYLANPCKI